MANWSMRRAWITLVCALLAAVAAATQIAPAVGALGTGGSTAEGTEATRAREAAERLGVPAPDLVLAVASPRGAASGSAASPEMLDALRSVTDTLAADRGVTAAWSYAGTRDPWLLSRDGRGALVLATLAGDEKQASDTAARLVPRARSAVPGLTVEPSGEMWTSQAIDEQVKTDLVRAELLAAPAVLLVLLVSYGSFLAALLPVLVAGLAVACTIPVLGLLSGLTDVSMFAVNAASAVGFGLAVDYTLFLLARYREETGSGADRTTALACALRTSGRSVVFSASAVGVCLTATLIIPVPLVRSLAWAGILVAALAALAALTVLPALVVLLGPRLERGDPLRRLRRSAVGDGSPFWRATTRRVTARPVLAGGAAVLLLALLAWPLTQVQLSVTDERVLPAGAAAPAAAAGLREEFAHPPERTLTVVLTGRDGEVPDAARSAAFRQSLGELPDVAAVRAVGPVPEGSVLAVSARPDPDSPQAEELVRTLRGLPVPGTVLVGGRAAEITDTRAAVRDAVPALAAALGGSLAVLLALFTRSVVAPLKALAMAVVSLGATLGVVVTVFQDGRGARLLGGFTVTGTVETSMLLFTLAVTLALSIDYEVFLLGRIKEEFDRCGDNRTAIVEGVARTGRLLTSAALAVAVSTMAIATSEVTVLKLVGAGVALGALLDAAVVRGVLVPAAMAALGPANWWRPGRARRCGPAAQSTVPPPVRSPQATP